MLVDFLGILFLLILIIKFFIWLISMILSRFGRKMGCGVKWTTDQGEYIVVAGACGHIGAEYAREFASMGFNLILIGRDADKLQLLAESFQERQYPVFDIQILEADFAVPDFADIIRDALEEVTPIVGLVNAIGVSYSAAKFTELGTQNIKDMMMINVVAPTMLIDIVLPKMSANQRGVIINLSSQVAKYKLPYYSVFGASKAYMHVLSEALSFEYANNGIIVQNVSPLFINSTMASEIRPNALRVSSALAVFSAMQTVGIESTTYGYWSHRVVALFLDSARFFLGSRLLTSIILCIMPRYISFRTKSLKTTQQSTERSRSKERRSKDSDDNADNLSELIRKSKHRRSQNDSREPKFNSKRESRERSKLDVKHDSKLDKKLEAKVDSTVESKVDSKVLESKFDPKSTPKTGSKVYSKIDETSSKVDSKTDSKVDSKVDSKLDSKQSSTTEPKTEKKRKHSKKHSKRHSKPRRKISGKKGKTAKKDGEKKGSKQSGKSRSSSVKSQSSEGHSRPSSKSSHSKSRRKERKPNESSTDDNSKRQKKPADNKQENAKAPNNPEKKEEKVPRNDPIKTTDSVYHSAQSSLEYGAESSKLSEVGQKKL